MFMSKNISAYIEKGCIIEKLTIAPQFDFQILQTENKLSVVVLHILLGHLDVPDSQ